MTESFGTLLHSLTGQGQPSEEDRATLERLRKSLNQTTLRYVALTAAALVLIQFFIVLSDASLDHHPWVKPAYLILFANGFAVSLVLFFVWTRWPRLGGQNAYMLYVLTEGVGLALCDLQLSGDYSTYVLVLFGTALLYSAPLPWYVLTFLASWVALVAGIAWTAPFPLGATPVAASGVLTVIGITAGVLLEVRRVRTERLNLELERKNREWKEASLRDSLTGLWNRRFLYEWLDQQAAQARRSGQPLAVALLDLDHFKLVNDTAGHQTGDAALVQAAQWLGETVREADVVARYGGEEFLVVLPDTDLVGSEAVIGRCLDTFRTCQVPGWPRPLTFSAGLTVLAPGESIKDLLQRVDELLYRAKSEGRNRITTG